MILEYGKMQLQTITVESNVDQKTFDNSVTFKLKPSQPPKFEIPKELNVSQ